MTKNKPTGFHVRHDLRPDFTSELLTLLHGLPEGQDERALQDAAEMQGYSLRQRKDYGKILRSLDELAIIDRSRQSIYLTKLGRTISNIMLYQHDLLPELIHVLYYVSYRNQPNKRFSWSYAKLCDWLWDSAPCEIHRDRLVNIVSQAAMEEFGESGISFSAQSVSGVLHWITALQPSCIDSSGIVFSRRTYCSVETFMVALHDTYALQKQDTLSIPITEDVKNRVCRICLITPESFSEMLELAERTFSGLQVWRKRGERLAITDFSWQTLAE